jgi:hypothetical protein
LPPALPSSVVAATDVAVVDGGFAADVVGRDSGAGSRQRCVGGGGSDGALVSEEWIRFCPHLELWSSYVWGWVL